jgi:hypothetical protein
MPDHLKAFMDGIRELSHRYHPWEIFEDFCECAAIEIYQPLHKNEEVEQRYISIMKKYSLEERLKLVKLFPHVVEGLERACNGLQPVDFLGQAFMQLELGNHYKGQFFTPDPISYFMARSLMLEQSLPENRPITLCEPACGAGGMVLNAALALKDANINYSYRLHVWAQDISIVCFHMSYIQLSLMGISAEVVLGDSLICQVRKSWRTPLSIMTGYTMAGINRDMIDSEVVTPPALIEPVPEPIIESIAVPIYTADIILKETEPAKKSVQFTFEAF